MNRQDQEWNRAMPQYPTGPGPGAGGYGGPNDMQMPMFSHQPYNGTSQHMPMHSPPYPQGGGYPSQQPMQPPYRHSANSSFPRHSTPQQHYPQNMPYRHVPNRQLPQAAAFNPQTGVPEAPKTDFPVRPSPGMMRGMPPRQGQPPSPTSPTIPSHHPSHHHHSPHQPQMHPMHHHPHHHSPHHHHLHQPHHVHPSHIPPHGMYQQPGQQGYGGFQPPTPPLPASQDPGLPGDVSPSRPQPKTENKKIPIIDPKTKKEVEIERKVPETSKPAPQPTSTKPSSQAVVISSPTAPKPAPTTSAPPSSEQPSLPPSSVSPPPSSTPPTTANGTSEPSRRLDDTKLPKTSTGAYKPPSRTCSAPLPTNPAPPRPLDNSKPPAAAEETKTPSTGATPRVLEGVAAVLNKELGKGSLIAETKAPNGVAEGQQDGNPTPPDAPAPPKATPPTSAPEVSKTVPATTTTATADAPPEPVKGKIPAHLENDVQGRPHRYSIEEMIELKGEAAPPDASMLDKWRELDVLVLERSASGRRDFFAMNPQPSSTQGPYSRRTSGRSNPNTPTSPSVPPSTFPGRYDSKSYLADLSRDMMCPVQGSALPHVKQATGLELAEKRIQGILNKLTPEKYQANFESLRQIIKDEAPDIFENVVNQVFEKAVNEPSFSDLYAELCKDLSELSYAMDPETVDKDGKKKKSPFRRALLTRCQAEFEKQVQKSETGTPRNEDELVELDSRNRKRSIGAIKFIGELFQRGLVVERIMHYCVQKLLFGTEKEEGKTYRPMADEIEMLCKLMFTCGEVMDHAKAEGYMDSYFQRIKELHDTPEVGSRLRFLLQDVVELRHRKWELTKAQASRYAKAHKLSEDEVVAQRGTPTTPSLADWGQRKR